jgi:hypothetical protein
MKMEVLFDTLNFIITGFVAAVIDLDARAFSKNLASRSICLPILALIQALLTVSRSIE